MRRDGRRAAPRATRRRGPRGGDAALRIDGRRVAGGLLALSAGLLIGAAPPRDFAAEAATWGQRARERLDELEAVGIDGSPYRKVWQRAELLAKRGFPEESLRTHRLLVADLEGWTPGPPPPRRPAAALLDEAPGPSPWDPLHDDDRTLTGSAGVGVFQARGGVTGRAAEPQDPRHELETLERSEGVGSYRRPLRSRTLRSLGARMRAAKVRDTATASQSPAARRRAAWSEEAARPDGAVVGTPQRRFGGGTVVRRERDTGLAEDEELALRGHHGVGYYGSPVRMARAGVFPVVAPELDQEDSMASDARGYSYTPGQVRPRPGGRDPMRMARADRTTGGMSGSMGSDMGGDLGDDLGGDLGDDLGGDLGDDLGGDLGDDLGGDLGDDLGGSMSDARRPGRDVEAPDPADGGAAPGPDPFSTWRGEDPDTFELVTIKELFTQGPARRAQLSGKRVIVVGTLSPPRSGSAPAELLELAGIPRDARLVVHDLHDGALGIEVLAREDLARGRRPETKVGVEGRYFHGSGRNLLAAFQVGPPPAESSIEEIDLSGRGDSMGDDLGGDDLGGDDLGGDDLGGDDLGGDDLGSDDLGGDDLGDDEDDPFNDF